MSAFVDTNVIVRYLIEEEDELTERATAIIESSEELIITDAVLAEVGYVLRKPYGLTREVVIDALTTFVQRENIRTYPMDKGLTLQALALCRPSGKISLDDALLWAVVQSTNIRTVYTFDRRFPSAGITLRQIP